MIITEHLSGVAVAYNPDRAKIKRVLPPGSQPGGRDQGSLAGYQKRAVANAVEYIRQTARHRAMLMTVTTSHRWPGRGRGNLLSTFIDNLKKNYDLGEYVWVREVGHVKPIHYRANIHYHFVADIDWLDPVKLSVYWSGLFGYHCRVKNSIRLGSKPDKEGNVRYFIDSPSAAWYLSKYIGKDLHTKSVANAPYRSKKPRSFAISETARVLSLPECYEGKLSFTQPPGEVLTAHGELIPHPVVCVGQTFENEKGQLFDKSKYLWRKCKDHQVWIGKIIR